MKLRAFFIVLAFSLIWGVAAHAQPIPETCDPKIKGQQDARAWMGGKRDMESAQVLILKRQEDSILDLSCYEGRVAALGKMDDNLFMDATTKWTTSPNSPANLFRKPSFCFASPACPCSIIFGCPPNKPYPQESMQPVITSPDGPDPPGGPFKDVDKNPLAASGNGESGMAMVQLIRWALRDYLYPNFYIGKLPPPPAVICGDMAFMWNFSKCVNFTNVGLPFATQQCVDPRFCEKCDPRKAGKWGTNYKIANPPPRPRLPAPEPDPPGGLDVQLTYRGTIYPQSCGDVAPVPTGVVVNIGEDNAHMDAVCPGVNCWYDYESGACKP